MKTFSKSKLAAPAGCGGLVIALVAMLLFAPPPIRADTFPFAGFQWQAFDNTPYQTPAYQPRLATSVVDSATEVDIKTPDPLISRGIKTTSTFQETQIVAIVEMWQTEGFNWQSSPFSVSLPFCELVYWNADQNWHFTTHQANGQVNSPTTYSLTPGGAQLGVHYFAKFAYDPATHTLVFSFRKAGAAYQVIYSGPSYWGAVGLENDGETGKVAKIFLQTSDGTGTAHYRLQWPVEIPTVTLLGNNPQIVWWNTPFIDPGATACDQNCGATLIAAGGFGNPGQPGFSLALQRNGQLLAWGDNTSGQTNVPPGLNNVTAIAAGGAHALALKSDGTVVAWGDNTYGQTNVPAWLSNVRAIAAGETHSLALRTDGTVVGWGDNTYGEATGASPYPATNTYSAAGVVTIAGQPLSNVWAVAAGWDHSLALQGPWATVTAWGAVGGQYWIGLPPSGLFYLPAIAAGGTHDLVLQNDGTVRTWGTYYNDEETPDSSGVHNVAAIACGGFHSLLLLNDGTVFGFGWNDPGQSLGYSTWRGIMSPPSMVEGLVRPLPAGWSSTNLPPVLSNVVAVAGGYEHSLALQRNGTVVAWGTPTNVPPQLISDLTSSLTASGTVNTLVAGHYPVTYTVTDSGSNTTVTTRDVQVALNCTGATLPTMTVNSISSTVFQLIFQDGQWGGLTEVVVLPVSNVASITVPAFPIGTPNPVVVTVTKAAPGSAHITGHVTNQCGRRLDF